MVEKSKEQLSQFISIPHSWILVKLEDIVDKIIGGGTPSKQNTKYYVGNIPWITVKDMTSRRPTIITDYINEEAVKNSSTNIIPADTLIIATRMSLGKIIRLPFEAAINQDLKAIFLVNFIDKDFVENWFISQANFLESLGTGTTVKGIRLEVLKSLKFPLPPLNEQKRIVAKIEALRERSQRARSELEAAKSLLEKLRQSILAAAFRGDLTADWRQVNPDTESAAILLERIRVERRRKWEEAELAKMIASGKPPINDKWKERYKEPEPIDAHNLPELPDGWLYTSVDSIATKITDGVHKKPNYVTSGIPFLSIKNLTSSKNSISFQETKFITEEDHKEFIKRANPEYGDILITKDGTLGITRKIRTNKVFSIFVSLALVKPVLYSLSDFLERVFSAPQLQLQMIGIGIGLTHIHLQELRAYILPLPPLEEQKEIVNRIEAAFKIADTLEAQINANLEDLNTLDQAILAKAFRGELVPQDPNDEPASELLKRIQQQKKGTPEPEQKKRKSKAKTPKQLSLDFE